MDTRYTHLHTWLKGHCQDFELIPLAGDASFRRYFRVKQANQTYIAMDAPPPTENCAPFIAIANALRKLNLRVPEIIASDVHQGFLLLSDFGDRLLLKTANPHNVRKLYHNACTALATLQTCRNVPNHTVPDFYASFMQNELQLANEWFFQKHLQLDVSAHNNMLDEFFNFLAHSAAKQPQVFMHRDFQTANLMVLDNDEIGILDFQDAFIGPVTYDLVSLLKDCYLVWPEKTTQEMALLYKNMVCPQVSDTTFLRWFDLMGIQRHIKALLTFARKFHRDNNPNYLRHMPRTLNYIATACSRYTECKGFSIFLNTLLLPTFEKVSYQCMQ